MTHSIGIFLFPEVEVLDFAGPYEVFTTANRVFKRCNPEAVDVFKVFTIARKATMVRARAGLEVKADYAIYRHPALDVLVIPGGVVTAEIEDTEVIDWISASHITNMITASVCTGAFLLAKAGLLRGKSATTHWEDMDDLRTLSSDVSVQDGRRWVDEGNIVTSGGISAGIDMSLHLVERLAGRELALKTARQMDIDWHEDQGCQIRQTG